MKILPIERIAPFILVASLLGQLPAAADDEKENTPTTPAKSAELSGSWILSSEGFGGATEATLTLRHEGAALSGTYEGGFGKSEIEEGMVGGDGISFKITRTFGDRVITGASRLLRASLANVSDLDRMTRSPENTSNSAR